MKILKFIGAGIFWLLAIGGFFFVKEAMQMEADTSAGMTTASLTYLGGYVLVIGLIVWGYSKLANSLGKKRSA